MGFQIQSSTYYKDILLEKVSNAKINEIYNEFSNCPWYMMLDETMDKKNQSIINVLVGKICTKEYEKQKVIYSGKIENTKCETIFPIVKTIANKLLNYNYSKANFKAFLTDGASYCRKLGSKLKEIYNCKHIICCCHNIHNFAEYLRKKIINYINKFLF